MPPAETDPIRRRNLSAMDRLLAGKPRRSTGRLNVSQLAIEAAVPRWHLTHQYVDLKATFQARIRAEGTTPAPFRCSAAALHDLQQTHRRLASALLGNGGANQAVCQRDSSTRDRACDRCQYANRD
jgi:hypothetical protein